MKKISLFLIFGIVIIFGLFIALSFPEHNTIIKEIIPKTLPGIIIP